MKKIVLIFFLILNSFLFSETFSEKQTILNEIQEQIAYEESVANAYEEYILIFYKIPTLVDTNFSKLIQTKNASSSVVVGNQVLNTNLNLSYGIKSDLNSEYKKIYESNMYRDRTFVVQGKVHFTLESAFAKHIVSLLGLKNLNSIQECPSIINSATTCRENNTIYIDVKERKLDTFTNEQRPNNFTVAYTIENFENGPYIVSTTTNIADEKVFSIIKNGVLIYDKEGDKFVKTTEGVKALQ